MNAKVSVSETHSHLSQWLKRGKTTSATITNRGKPVGVVISPKKYEPMRRAEAYLRLLQLAKTFREEEDVQRGHGTSGLGDMDRRLL
jgi:prevent-host-death family protein